MVSDHLKNCEDEQIRIPGYIQSDSFLIVYSSTNKTITHFSENVSTLLEEDKPAILHSHITQWIAQTLCDQIENHFLVDSAPFIHLAVEVNKCKYPLYAQKKLDFIYLEFSLDPESRFSEDQILYAYNHIVSNMTSDLALGEVFDQYVDDLRRITSYDRVMLYKFDDEWNGDVIAESKAEALTPFLGLSYPATDIPPQARDLYLSNTLRTIHDVNYEAIPIYPASDPLSDNPLDLSHTIYRSVSPIHVEYLKNMGVGATLVISILVNKKLWGLIACHHNAKKSLKFSHRLSLELLSVIFGKFLESRLDELASDKINKNLTKITRLYQRLIEKWDLNVLIEKEMSGDLLQIMSADGVGIFKNGAVEIIGDTPSKECVIDIINQVKLNDDNLFHTHSLIGSGYDDYLDTRTISGLFVLSLVDAKDECILWFRNEKRHHVTWAGNPYLNKIGAENRISPRKSFESWKENVAGKSSPWLDSETRTALALRATLQNFFFLDRKKLNEKVKEKTLELTNTISEISQAKKLAENSANLRKRFLANMSHEVRTPLNSIIGFNYMIHENVKNEDLKKWSSMALTASNRLLKTINSVLDASKKELNEELIELKPFNLSKVVTQLCAEFSVLATTNNLAFSKDLADQIQCLGDQDKLERCLSNILNNAIKFTDKGSIGVHLYSLNSYAHIEVTDSGIGISSSFLEQIFEPFSQEHSDINRKHEGSGLGLFLTKEYLQLMGGSISIKSVKNEGMQVTLQIPIVNE